MRDGRPAAQLVLERVPATLAITLPAFALKLFIGIPARSTPRSIATHGPTG